MKNILFLISFFFIFSCSDKKESVNNILNLKETFFLNDTPVFGINKNTVLKQYGKPLNISTPEYECGSYSNETQGAIFEILHYNGFQMIGSNKSVYSLDQIDFYKLPENLFFRINNIILNKETTKEDAIKKFEEKYKFNIEDNLLIFPTNSDFQLILEFENNKLFKCYFDESC